MVTSHPPTLSIVIVNWNSGELLRACLRSIASSSASCFSLSRVIVVDNASSDGSLPLAGFDDLPLGVMRNRENTGFAAACNQGAQGVSSDLLLFLNPDTRLSPQALDASVAFLLSPAASRVGVCGVAMLDDTGAVSRSCARFPRPRHFLSGMLGLDRVLPELFPGVRMLDWDHASSRPVDHVIGAFYLLRTALFKDLGGFDERFFVYLEDLDFSLRATRAGWNVHYLADTTIYHKGGGSSDAVRGKRLYYSLRSRIQFAGKHFSKAGFLCVWLAVLTLEFLTRMLRALLSMSWRTVAETVHAYALLWSDAFHLLRNRPPERRPG